VVAVESPGLVVLACDVERPVIVGAVGDRVPRENDDLLDGTVPRVPEDGVREGLGGVRRDEKLPDDGGDVEPGPGEQPRVVSRSAVLEGRNGT